MSLNRSALAVQPAASDRQPSSADVLSAAGAGRPLRVAIVCETFARGMGYANNILPKYLARLGHDVHVLTSDLLPYHQLGSAEALYGKDFVERNRPRLGTEEFEGYTLHTLPYATSAGYPRLRGLVGDLGRLAPDLVCIFVSAGWIALDCAYSARRHGHALVVGSHTGATSFPLAQRPQPWYSKARMKGLLLRQLPGMFVSSASDHCVVPTRDCGEIASRFFGQSAAKVRVQNLPVDEDHFHPVAGDPDRDDRRRLRAELGVADDELLCVYSGKFTEGKNPVVLLKAIDRLAAEGHAVRGLFIGSGPQQPLLQGQPRVIVRPFMALADVGRHYRAADVGVWMEESTSFLDAACCGLPLVLGSTVRDTSHVQEFARGYASDDDASLAQALRPLLDGAVRHALAARAAELGLQRFAASRYAAQRVDWFRQALRARGGAGA
jgi:glycosyltransferase involved in cell wall biosynthesis